MTNAGEVPRIPCSVGARQAEPPAPQNGLVHVFSRGGNMLQPVRCRPTGPGVFGTEQLNVLTLHDKFQDFDD